MGVRSSESMSKTDCPVDYPVESYAADDPLNATKEGDKKFGIGKAAGPQLSWTVAAARTDRLSAGDGQRQLKQIGLTRELHEQIVSASAVSERPVVVAVIDSGVDLSHPELWGQLWRNRGEIAFNGIDDDRNGYIDDVYGYNTQADNSNIADEIGHGTAVAGIIAARWDDRGIGGVAPHCRLMIVKAFDKSGRSDSARVSLAIRYAVLNGANIIHLSAENSEPHEVDQAMIAWAIDKGVLVIAASGSHGRDTASVSPANLQGVLTVGACDATDRRAEFSGWGRHVDLVAPGVDVLSLRARGTDFMHSLGGETLGIAAGDSVVDERWYRARGTSFSAPLVTGAAAAIWAADPRSDRPANQAQAADERRRPRTARLG